MIQVLQESIGIKAKIKFTGMQPGDVKKTYANIDHSRKKLGYDPKIFISKGIPKFVSWFKSYNRF